MYLQRTANYIPMHLRPNSYLWWSNSIGFEGHKFNTDVTSMPEVGKNTAVQAMLQVALSENTNVNKWWEMLMIFGSYHKTLEIHKNIFPLYWRKLWLKVFFPQFSESKAF